MLYQISKLFRSHLRMIQYGKWRASYTTASIIWRNCKWLFLTENEFEKRNTLNKQYRHAAISNTNDNKFKLKINIIAFRGQRLGKLTARSLLEQIILVITNNSKESNPNVHCDVIPKRFLVLRG